MDRKGENIIIYPAIVIMAVGILMLSQTQNSVMLLASAALLGFGFGNIQSVCQTIAVKVPLCNGWVWRPRLSLLR